MTALLLLRGEDPPAGAAVVVRGGEHGLEHDVLRRTAGRTFEEYGFYGISVFVVLDGTLDQMCAEVDQVRRYRRVRLSTAGDLRRKGFPLLATGRRPHFDIALPDLDANTLDRLMACFGPQIPNPGRPS